jgi:hypothetical protein
MRVNLLIVRRANCPIEDRMPKVVDNILVLALLCGLTACSSPPAGSQAAPGTLAPSQPVPSPPVPAHRVNDVWKSGPSVWLFLVVDSSLSEEGARQLAGHYRSQYPDAKVLNIDMFCDDRYASHVFVDTRSISDAEFYSHVLYSYMTGPFETVFHTPSNPANRAQGSGCRKPPVPAKRGGRRR